MFFEFVKFVNVQVKEDASKEFAEELLKKFHAMCEVLGIILEQKEEILDVEIEQLIEERQAARKNKNFARADEIRDILLEKGIVLKDTREGVQWNRV